MGTDLFVYGSLMHPDEISDLFGSNVGFQKVKLNNYVRDFSKIAHSWGSEDENVGVLGILPEEGEWCNGLIIKDLSREQMNDYYKRETGMSIEDYDEMDSGYKIVSIGRDEFTSYNTSSLSVGSTVETAVINNRLDEPNTFPEYRDLCYDAAKKQGSEFYRDFKETTYEFFEPES